MSAAVNLEKAMRDPQELFTTPEEVAAHPGLTRAQKIELLCRWEYDAAEEEVATEEGMPGGDHGPLRRILRALDGLIEGADFGSSGPTKQHAFCPRRAWCE